MPLTYISNAKVLEIAKKVNIMQLKDIILAGNNLTDLSVKPLLNRDFPFLLYLNLNFNPQLTSECLVGMKNRTY